ncbi:hypothetical protein ACFL6S_17775 [Candidatus Poribacteria bacterium]
MSKTLTKHEVNLKKFRRINDKSLRQHLIHKFLNSYGYDKGEVTAQAIVDDILKTIEHYFVLNSSAVGGPTSHWSRWHRGSHRQMNAIYAMVNWCGWQFQ